MKLTALIFLALFLPAPAFAGPLEDGTAAFNRGDWPAALKLLQPLAAQGNAQAQNDIGDMYQFGHGVKKDSATAMDWYRKAADQGNAQGEFNVGNGYKSGLNAPKDNAEALKWYRKAADQGNRPAQLMLSGLYIHGGNGVKKDQQEAYFWFLLFSKSAPGESDASKMHESQLAGFYAGDLTPEQIAGVKKRVDEWKPVTAVPVVPPPAAAKP